MEDKKLINLENLDLESYYERIEENNKKIEKFNKKLDKIYDKGDYSIEEQQKYWDEISYSATMNDLEEKDLYDEVLENIVDKEFLKLIQKEPKKAKDITRIKEQLESIDKKLAYYICDYITEEEQGRRNLEYMDSADRKVDEFLDELAENRMKEEGYIGKISDEYDEYDKKIKYFSYADDFIKRPKNK